MRRIQVIKKKYDGSLRERHESHLVSEDDIAFTLLTLPGMDGYDHGKQREAPNLDGMLEIYFKQRWYNVWHICERHESTTLIYANVAMPAVLTSGKIEWIDLDLDVRVDVDGSLELLDEEQFHENVGRLQYPEDVVHMAKGAWNEVARLASEGRYPFDHETQLLHYRQLTT